MSDLIERARAFATAAHAGQARKYTGEPYIVHPEEVAGIVHAAGLSDEAVAAAWLHDVVEDCGVHRDVIGALFGPTVDALVFALTDADSNIGNRKTRKQLDRERIALAPADAQTIKAADLISNTATIVDHDPDFARTYLTEKRAMLEVLSQANPVILSRAWDTLQAAEFKIYGPLAMLAP